MKHGSETDYQDTYNFVSKSTFKHGDRAKYKCYFGYILLRQ
jgi:hypothetical protein